MANVFVYILVIMLLTLAGCAQLIPETDTNTDAVDGIELLDENRLGDVYAEMGKEYMKFGQFEVALRKLQKGLTIDPDNPKIHVTLGLLYETLNKIDLAERHYVRALEISPNNPEFLNAWGNFLCQRKKYNSADVAFNKALTNPLYAEPWVAITNAGLCAIRAGRKDVGELYLRRALTTKRDIPPALWALAELQMDKRDYASAQEYSVRYERIVGKTPQNLLLRCKAALGLGDKVTASSLKEELKQLYPDSSETQIARGLVSP